LGMVFMFVFSVFGEWFFFFFFFEQLANIVCVNWL